MRIGGTDFDRAINIDRVMPLLGKGSVLRKVMGDGTSPTPNAIYNDLATWEKIPFVYTPQNTRMVAEMVRLAQEPEKLSRLATVLEDELGHDLAFATERGKIAANGGQDDPRIMLDMIQRGLSAPLTPQDLDDSLSRHGDQLSEGAQVTLGMAGLRADQVDQVIYVGGSSLMTMVSDRMRALFPDAQHSFSEVFTAVADGLAIAANRG